MPNGWTRVATPRHIREEKNPGKKKRLIQEAVAKKGAALDEVYFTDDQETYALIHIPGTPERATQIVNDLEEALGSEMMVLFTVEELPENGSAA